MMNTERIVGISRVSTIASAFVLAFILALVVFAPQAFANRDLDAPISVADDITRLHVNKLDSDTHEPVANAKMVIVDENGNTVAEWVSDGSTFKIEKGLDVGVEYTLKELDPPEGYSAISPITFVVDPVEGNGIIIKSAGDESQYDLRVTFGGLQVGVCSTLNLYDQAMPVENEVVVTETRGTSSNTSGSAKSTSTTPAPKTGDEAPLFPVAVFVVVGIIGIGLLEIPKRHVKD